MTAPIPRSRTAADDILVGPLRSMDAYHLVVDPMNALGYKFESPDLVWRLLLLTNYQASLVQILCEALVRELSRRDFPRGGGRIFVTGGDVESVYARRDVRDLIVQRFRWTINLDSRYRVIALVVALQSLDPDTGDTFTPKELQEYCEVFWPIGFAAEVLSDKEFERYLNEMVGLGVLHRQGDQYGLRSPNIISLLGDSSYLNRELDEASRHLELQYEYNPTMNRRNLGHSTELSARRSPLSDQDIASLLGQDGARETRVKIVTGSPALAIDRAARVVQDVALEQQIPCDLVRAENVDRTIAGTRIRRHLIVDLSDDNAPQADLTALCARLAANDHVTANRHRRARVAPAARGARSARCGHSRAALVDRGTAVVVRVTLQLTGPAQAAVPGDVRVAASGRGDDARDRHREVARRCSRLDRPAAGGPSIRPGAPGGLRHRRDDRRSAGRPRRR